MLCIKYLINLEEKAIKYPLESIPESTIKQQIVNTNTNLNINKNTETNINKKTKYYVLFFFYWFSFYL